jgi:hypothetical protein
MIDAEVAMTARRSDRSDLYFRHLVDNGQLTALLAHLLPGRALGSNLAAVLNHDDRAGHVCALTALCVAAGDFIAVGDKQDGWIVLPPQRFVKRWAFDFLVINADEEAASASTLRDHWLSVCCPIGDMADTSDGATAENAL